jgi:addiction module RelB/DinJ family antitoxin
MHIRINPDIKERAMPILKELSISIGEYFNMALSQLVQQHRVPFELGDSVYYSFMPDFEKDVAEAHSDVINGAETIKNSNELREALHFYAK